MMEKDRVDRRAFLDKLSTEQLEDILRKDVDSEGSENQDLILEILSILQDRDKTKIDNINASWQEFQEHYNTTEGQGLSLYPVAEAAAKKKDKKLVRIRKFAAAAAAVIVLVCAVPPALGAGNIVELISRWTDETFSFINSSEEPVEEREFVYLTDNLDLQEIYDVVQQLGVADNVVPSWIPEGFEKARDIKISDLYNFKKVSTLFEDADGNTIKFTAKIYANRQVMGKSTYEKDETEVEILEINGVTHYIMKNIDKWVVVWIEDNVECMIGTCLEKDELVKIIYSIYEEVV